MGINEVVCVLGGLQCWRASCSSGRMVLGPNVPCQDRMFPQNTKYQYHLYSNGKLGVRPKNKVGHHSAKVSQALSCRGWHAAMLCFYWHEVDVQSTYQFNLYSTCKMPEISCSLTLVRKGVATQDYVPDFPSMHAPTQYKEWCHVYSGAIFSNSGPKSSLVLGQL